MSISLPVDCIVFLNMMKSMSSHFHTQSSMFVKIKRTYQFLASEISLTPDGQLKTSEYVIIMKMTFNLNFPQWVMFDVCGIQATLY